MNIFNGSSLRHRFIFTLVSVVVFIFLIFSVTIIYQNVTTIETQLDKQLLDASTLAEKSLSSAIWQYNNDFVGDFVESLFLYEDIVFAKVLSGNEVIKEKNNSGFPEKDFLFFQQSSRFSTKETNISFAGKTIGKIQIALTRDRIKKTIHRNIAITTIFMLLMISAIILTIYFISKRYIFGPLSKLENSAAEIAGGDWDAYIDTSGTDEIGNLSKTFDQMMKNLKATTASRDELEREIRERIQAQDAKKQEHALSNTIIDSIPGTFYMLDINGRYVRWNIYQRDEIVGKSESRMVHVNAMDTIHPDDHQIISSKIANVLKNGMEETVEGRVLLHGGPAFRWFLLTGRQMIINGSPFLIGTGIDITERKLMDDKLRESENRFRDITHSMADWIWEVDKNAKFTYVSDTVKNTLGYSSKELIGKTPFELMPEGERAKMRAVLLEIASKSGQIVDLENWNLAKDGTEVCLLTNGVPIIDADGELQGYRGVDKDITNQKKLEAERITIEAQLQQAQKMEAVGTLAGGIAHDFNNILAVILGNTELASFDVPDSNRASESLKAIHRASIRAKDMVQQLLSFSRKTDQESKPINMSPIIRESMKMLRSAIPTSVEFKQHVSDDLCSVMGDASQINQIVMNLVSNAADAMSEEGGLLEATLEKIILQEEKACFDWVLSPGPYVKLTMRDTGEGIEPKTMDRIFEPYYTTKEIGKGTGMGLSVIHGIVKRHGGGIWVTSTLGKGTLFEIYFPALEETAEEEKEPDGEIKGGYERILFVDDEESMVDLNRQRLERLGYQVRSTTKPLEALEWFKADSDQFDVIITDMTMPRMTGDRLAAEILKIRPNMPVIICTGYSERMSVEKAKALGVRKYIEKPIGLRNLASSLREVLEGK